MKRIAADPQASFEHRRSSVREGWQLLLGGGGTVAGLAAAPALFFSKWQWSQGDQIFVIVWYSFLTLFGMVFAYYGFRNIVQCRDFVCRLDDHTIECRVPLSGVGDSFDLKLSNIAKVERNQWSESHRWYIWDTAGNRFWLTSNYGNPADRFIRAILEKNPAVVEIQS